MTSAPTQERSRVRRDALLRAAIRLLSEGGTRAVTHRAVGAEAGVPAAAVSYYFTTIQELTEQALRLHVQERVVELQYLAAQAATDGGTIGQIAARFTDVLNGRDAAGTVAQFEVYLEAARNPALREAVAESLHQFEELAAAVLTALGARRPHESAAAFVALINGFALNRIARPTEDDAANLLEAMRSMFVTQLMTEKQLTQFLTKLDQAPARAT